jgi:hypothetical protein
MRCGARRDGRVAQAQRRAVINVWPLAITLAAKSQTRAVAPPALREEMRLCVKTSTNLAVLAPRSTF